MKENLPFFEGLNNALSTGVTASIAKSIFGDIPVTKILKATNENWMVIQDFVDGLVEK